MLSVTYAYLLLNDCSMISLQKMLPFLYKFYIYFGEQFCRSLWVECARSPCSSLRELQPLPTVKKRAGYIGW